MSPVLSQIIKEFRAAQDRAVNTIVELLGGTLGVTLPESGPDWVGICNDCGLQGRLWINGIRCFRHGFGIHILSRPDRQL